MKRYFSRKISSYTLKEIQQYNTFHFSYNVCISKVRKCSQESVAVILKCSPGDSEFHPACQATAKFCNQELEKYKGMAGSSTEIPIIYNYTCKLNVRLSRYRNYLEKLSIKTLY